MGVAQKYIRAGICFSFWRRCNIVGQLQVLLLLLHTFKYTNGVIVKYSNFIFCRVFIIVGVILLVSSARIIALLPRPLRRLVRSNIERNHNIRRTGSVRIKDSSPSTVVHASTLHHVISSSAKEKAQITIKKDLYSDDTATPPDSQIQVLMMQKPCIHAANPA